MTVLELFPLKLLLTLVGVGLLFSLASVNGTMAALTNRLLSNINRRAAIPPTLFLVTTLIAALGVGNIAATALVAPTALALAPRLGMSPFLVSILVIGGANAGALSPLSMTGILAKELLASIPIDHTVRAALAWRMFFTTLASISVVHGLGFLILGGLPWLRRREKVVISQALTPTDHTERSRLSKPQVLTLIGVFTFAALLILMSLPKIQELLIDANLGPMTNPGALALAVSAGIICFKLSSFRLALSVMPWKAIMLITSMFFLAGVIEEVGVLGLIAEKLAAIGKGPFLPAWMALIAGLLSSVSSSSGVVMPLMMPMVSSLAGDQGNLTVAIVLGAHLVDCSPLSSLGAICIGAAPNLSAIDRRRLFRSLLVWGIAMAPVGALLAAIILR